MTTRFEYQGYTIEIKTSNTGGIQSVSVLDPECKVIARVSSEAEARKFIDGMNQTGPAK